MAYPPPLPAGAAPPRGGEGKGADSGARFGVGGGGGERRRMEASPRRPHLYAVQSALQAAVPAPTGRCADGMFRRRGGVIGAQTE
eukprot:830205-Prorocentrum_minimum.AAC.1